MPRKDSTRRQPVGIGGVISLALAILGLLLVLLSRQADYDPGLSTDTPQEERTLPVDHPRRRFIPDSAFPKEQPGESRQEEAAPNAKPAPGETEGESP